MAKLSARGRTVVYTVRQTRTTEDGESTTTVALMSDNVILQKYSFPFEYSKSGRHTTIWKVRGKLKEGSTPAQWLEHKIKNGWEQVK